MADAPREQWSNLNGVARQHPRREEIEAAIAAFQADMIERLKLLEAELSELHGGIGIGTRLEWSWQVQSSPEEIAEHLARTQRQSRSSPTKGKPAARKRPPPKP